MELDQRARHGIAQRILPLDSRLAGHVAEAGAAAGIRDLDQGLLALAAHGEAHGVARRGIGDGVGDEVEEDMRHAFRVGDDGWQAIGHVERHAHPGLAEPVLQAFHRILNGLRHIHRLQRKFDRTFLDAGEVEDVIGQREHRIGGLRKRLRIALLALAQRPEHAARQGLRIAHHHLQRRAQFEGYRADELRAQARGIFQRLIMLAQALFGLDRVGHVACGHEGRVVGQRGRCHDQGPALRRHHLGLLLGTRIGETADLRRDFLPQARKARLAGTGDLLDVRIALQNRGLHVPEPREGRIRELQAAIGPKHRDTFGERHQRLPLGILEAIIGGCEREALGLVLEEIGDAALRIGRDHHAQGTAIRQGPGMGDTFDVRELREELRFPGLVIRGLGQAPVEAQTIENLAIGRPGREIGRVEREEIAERLVGIGQLLARIEHRDGGGQFIQRADMRIHLATQRLARRLEIGDVQGEAAAALLAAHFHDIQPAALPRQDSGQRAAELAAALRLLANGRTIRAVEQFHLPFEHLGFVAGIHRPRIGRVHPEQPASGVAQPGRLGNGIQHAAHLGEHPVDGPALILQLRDLKALAPQLAHDHHRAPRNRASLDLDTFTAQGAQGGAEKMPLLPQPESIAFEVLRILGSQPFGEGQHARARIGIEQNAGITLDLRLAGSTAPRDHHLPVRGEEGREPGRLPLRLMQGARGLHGVVAPGLARADMQDGNEGRIDRHDHQREGERHRGAGEVQPAIREAGQAQARRRIRDGEGLAGKGRQQRTGAGQPARENARHSAPHRCPMHAPVSPSRSSAQNARPGSESVSVPQWRAL